MNFMMSAIALGANIVSNINSNQRNNNNNNNDNNDNVNNFNFATNNNAGNNQVTVKNMRMGKKVKFSVLINQIIFISGKVTII